MRRGGLFLLALVAILAVLVPVQSASGKKRLQQNDSSVGPGACSGNISGDFDNNASDDLVVGVPGEDLKGLAQAGAVNVLYGGSSSEGLSVGGNGVPEDQFWHQGKPGIPDRPDRKDKFGRCVASADFNNDGYSDLVIGAPGEKVGGHDRAGSIFVIYGSQDGLDPAGSIDAQQFSQDSPGVPDSAEKGDEFGSALAPGDFDDDGYIDVAIGAPLEDDGVENSGSITILYGSDQGLTADGSQYFDQDSEGVLDAAEPDDKFGASLASGDANGDGVADLAVGIPEENIRDGAQDEIEAGAVQVFYGDDPDGLTSEGDQFWHQDSSGVLDEAEDGDNFGWAVTFGDFDKDGRDDLAVGTSFESIGAVSRAGAVNVLLGSASGLTADGDLFLHRGNDGLPGDPEPSDFFGASLVAAEFENGPGFDDLAVGIPGQTVNGRREAGAVNVYYSRTGSGLVAPAQLFTQDTPDIEDEAERLDHFGLSVAAGSYDANSFYDLAIGVPGENAGRGNAGQGAVHVIYAAPGGLDPNATPQDEIWTQDTPGVENKAEVNDLFGRTLG